MMNYKNIIPVETSEFNPDNWSKDSETMLEWLEQNPSAIFVTSNMFEGSTTRSIAFNADPYVIFNPVIVHTEPTLWSAEEISPLFPGLAVKIKRPQAIRVRFKDYQGNIHTNKYEGLTAKYIIQGIEVLNGETRFYNKASPYHKELSMKKWRKSVRT